MSICKQLNENSQASFVFFCVSLPRLTMFIYYFEFFSNLVRYSMMPYIRGLFINSCVDKTSTMNYISFSVPSDFVIMVSVLVLCILNKRVKLVSLMISDKPHLDLSFDSIISLFQFILLINSIDF